MKFGRFVQISAALAIALLWVGMLGIAHRNGELRLLDRAEAVLTDLRLLMRGPKPAPDSLTIVAIDDLTVGTKGGYPLPRTELAAVIEAIAGKKPRVIAVDLLLLDQARDNGDPALVQALQKSPAVIAAAAVFPESSQYMDASDDDPLSRLPRAEKFLLPLPALADRAAVGVVNLATDQSGTPRGVPMLFRSADRLELSFALRVAAFALGGEPAIEADRVSLAGRQIATDIGHVLPLSFYGPQGKIRTISAASVLNGEAAEAALRDRVVVVGATVTGGGDVFPTPFDPVMPGVEVIATAIGHLMSGGAMVRDRTTRTTDALLAAALTLLLMGLVGWHRSAVGFISIVAVISVWVAGNYFAFSRGIWLSAALPIAAAAPPVICFGAVQLWLNRRQAHYFAMKSDLLQQFQAPPLRTWLTENPDFLLEPLHLDAAVIFVDLSGFTSLSESLGMDAALALLKDFHTLIDGEVIAQGGIITSFLGDGAMIVFGLPESTPDDARNAALCCVEVCNRLEKWIESLPPAIAARTGFKVGAHFGPLVASRLGGSYQHITATGDTVNVASRLMEVAAKQSAVLAVTDDLLRRAGPECALFQFGSLTGPTQTRIRGRSGILSVRLWRNDSTGLDESGLLR